MHNDKSSIILSNTWKIIKIMILIKVPFVWNFTKCILDHYVININYI